MTCREFAEFILEYVSGDLAPESRREFERHLTLCTNCQKYLTGYQETVKLGKQAFDNPDLPVPSGVPEDLVQAILNARHVKRDV